MPYIKMEDRERFLPAFRELASEPPKTKGELEFLIYTIMKLYMDGKERNYHNLHDTTYAAQHCADEYRRRNLDKREDDARSINGDVV